MKSKIIYLFQFILFFGIFYSENFSIGSLTISHLWKIPLLAYMIYVVLSNASGLQKFKSKYLCMAYKLAFVKLLNRDIVVAPVLGVVNFSRYLNFPILIQFLRIQINSQEKNFRFLVRLCQFGILSYIPFLLGILEEPRDAYGAMELEDYLSAAQSHVGLFQNPHGASVFLSVSFLVLLHYTKQIELTRLLRIYNYCLLGLCLYCLYTSYVRTGYLMFVIGLLFYCWPKRFRFYDFIKLSLGVLCAILLVSYIMNTNEYFRARVLELDKNGEKRETVGSGRLVFAKNGLDLYFNKSNIYEFLLGHGQEEVKDNNAKMLHNKSGRIYSHNGFVDALAQNGIIGLYYFLCFYICIYRRIRRMKVNPSFKLALSWLLMTISFQFTQGGVGFLSDLLGALIMNNIEFENRKRLML